jgi:putative transposase
MLMTESFEHWCHRLALSEQAKALIARIRTSPPSRRVQSAAGNVSGRYPSQKMGYSIQFESHRDELAFIYSLEHDPAVLEFYDQPGKIVLSYLNKDGTRQVTAQHTPDFFVLLEDGAGWTECKMEDHLVRLAQEKPNRYQHHPDGSWACPPGEAYAASFGLFYRVRSSKATNWTSLRNLRFLEDYLREPYHAEPTEVGEAVLATVMRQPGIALLELLHLPYPGVADVIYSLIATDRLFVDLFHTLLPDPARVPVFPDREVATGVTSMTSFTPLAPRPVVVALSVGTPLWWDEKLWTVVNPGASEITLLSSDHSLQAIERSAFEALLRAGKLTAVSSQAEEQRFQAAQELLAKASPKHLEIALQRYRALGGTAEKPVAPRTLRRWQARFRAAEACYGNGYVGLLPDWSASGNRAARLSETQERLLETFIATRYETLTQQPKRAVYLLLTREAKQQQVAPPSYTTFLRRIARRERQSATRKRKGPRAAAQEAPWFWELEQTTPRHGDRPWDVVHMDHTQLDVELVSSRTGRPLGRPWATFLTDAFSRRLLALYLTFDPSSYRSCLMTLRECVWRYGRLPQTLIVDGGAEFHSTYFETLLAYYGCTKATRPWSQPRYGSVCERLFGTANTQFVHNLLGNTQIMMQVRQVTKSIAPRNQAVWTLGDLYAYLREWADEIYETAIHPALGQSPREAFTAGLLLGGERVQRLIRYDEQFTYLSLATTRKGTAKVASGRGVKIHGLYSWSSAFQAREVESTQVPVRYDPFDIGTAYAYVQGRWVKCLSEYHLQLRGHSERELQLASAELHQAAHNHAGETAVTAKRLAEFLASLQGHEVVLLQRMHDLEAKEVLTQMGSSRALPVEPQAEPHASQATLGAAQRIGEPERSRAGLAEQTGPASEDMETLDSYEEYH